MSKVKCLKPRTQAERKSRLDCATTNSKTMSNLCICQDSYIQNLCELLTNECLNSVNIIHVRLGPNTNMHTQHVIHTH